MKSYNLHNEQLKAKKGETNGGATHEIRDESLSVDPEKTSYCTEHSTWTKVESKKMVTKENQRADERGVLAQSQTRYSRD